MESERKRQENPFFLSLEDLTYPQGGGKQWLNQLIERQKEGIKQGFRPQMPRLLSKDYQRHWRNSVWGDWLKSLPEGERSIIRRTAPCESEGVD